MRKLIALMIGAFVSSGAFADVVISNSPYDDTVKHEAYEKDKLPYVTVAHQDESDSSAHVAVFSIAKGERLSAVLKRWAKTQNGDAVWRASRDFIIKADASYDDRKSLPEAVKALLNDMGSDVSDKIFVTVFKNGYVKVEDAGELK